MFISLAQAAIYSAPMKRPIQLRTSEIIKTFVMLLKSAFSKISNSHTSNTCGICFVTDTSPNSAATVIIRHKRITELIGYQYIAYTHGKNVTRQRLFTVYSSKFHSQNIMRYMMIWWNEMITRTDG